MNDEQPVEVIGTEVGSGPLGVLLTEHHELHATGPCGNRGLIAHKEGILLEELAKLAPGHLPIVFCLDFNDQARSDRGPIRSGEWR